MALLVVSVFVIRDGLRWLKEFRSNQQRFDNEMKAKLEGLKYKLEKKKTDDELKRELESLKGE
jgi:Sec-independent protein translocase protein TatA